MPLYPHAKHRLMPYNDQLPKRAHAATVICHTNGGGTDKGSLYAYFAGRTDHVCSHFQVMWDGTVEQYVDTDREAYAQFAGNAYGVSIETQDDGHSATAWTPAQVASIVGVCQWLGVPARLSPDGPGGGVGWHEQFRDWNEHSHVCPGKVREAQIRTEIIPRLGDDMPTPDDLLNAHIGRVDDDPHHVDHTVKSLLLSLAHEVFAIRAQTQQILTNKKDD